MMLQLAAVQIARDGIYVRAWTWWRGQFYLASVLLPSFVAADPDGYPSAIEIAETKATTELNAMFGRVLGVLTYFTPYPEKNHA